MSGSNSIFESDFLNVSEHDGFGGGEWEIVLEDSQVTVSDLDSVVFVQNLGHAAISNWIWLISIISNYFELTAFIQRTISISNYLLLLNIIKYMDE